MLIHLQGKEHLAENVAFFGRALRRAGLPVGTGDIADAQTALQWAGIESREDVHAALGAIMVKRHEHQPLFDQAFALYWQNPRLAEKMMRMLLPTIYGRTSPQDKTPDTFARIQQAMQAARPRPPQEFAQPEEEIALDAAMSFSERDALAHKDFESLTREELTQVRAAMRKIRLPLPMQTTRRTALHPHGHQIDRRQTFRNMLRGGEMAALAWHKPRKRSPPLVILTDISGSMDRYARLLLLFLHQVANDNARVETFLFGTRLTRITKALKHRDVEVAMQAAGQAAPDWAGGTRLTACLAEFNRHWARRMLGQSAVVLLISDGLDAQIHADGAAQELSRQAERLAKSCKRLLWLNPLLRFAGFEARPLGIKAVLPHVDAFIPVHNLASIEQLAQALSEVSHTSRAANRAAIHERYLAPRQPQDHKP